MIKCKNFRFWGILLGKWSVKVSNLHDGRRQQGASFEYGAMFWTNLNLGLIRELGKYKAFFEFLNKDSSIFCF